MPLVLNGIQNTTSGSGSLIAITHKPVKLNYIEGERLSLNGIQVTFYPANKTPIVVEDYITIPAKDTILSRSDSQVVIQYRSNDGEYFQTVLPINIKYPVNIEVKNLPNRSYKKADNINLKGLKIDLIYNDNSRSLVDNTKITSYPADGTPLGNNTSLLFTYNDEDVRLDCFYELGGKGSNDIDETKITTFASGTWEQIKQMIEASKLGKFDMQDYWKVGDVRSKDVNGTTFGDDLVVLDFNKKKSEYNNSNTVIIGNKSVSKTGSCRSIYDETHSGCYWRYSPYLGDNYEYFNNIIKNSSLSNIVLKNVNAQVSKIFDMTPNETVPSYSGVGGGKFPISIVDKKYTDTYLRIPTNNDIIGDNAFEYYKISSNRVKYNASNTPVKYMLDNVSNTHSWSYWALSSYYNDKFHSQISENNYYECPMPIITFGCIDTNGEYINYDVAHNRLTLLDQVYYTYYFAIG